ncbi:FAD-dependent oxidoreductase [Chitinilyticum piscinae]|uniref:NAD(P)/FAD-dependent oxidoreductase n=1 Tax=Chitinilyticum piscinae TaxID=2866724 RepID=A0A8J7FJ75_9NEIS|nr:FAD-dependent oxidoreductase [Chitinilyticum piscinae]MBE9607859.1 NAD(P)/FAD-dependent oxidoreductase [Chitinilyticum piscinae]
MQTGQVFDAEVLIIGGGVGGLTLAQWLSGMGHRWLLLEAAAQAGGALAHSDYPLKWIPGFAGISGRQYMARVLAEVDAARLLCGDQPETVEVLRHGFALQTRLGRNVRVRSLALACGARPFSPYPPAPRLLVGPGLAALAEVVPGMRVAVLGGGDNALEHALILARRGCAVSVLARGAIRGSALLRQQVVAEPAIAVHEHCGALQPACDMAGVSLAGQRYDYACVFYGYEPVPVLAQFPQLAVNGLPAEERGVFWLGDMTRPAYASVLLTQGEAAVVARKLDDYLQRA